MGSDDGGLVVAARGALELIAQRDKLGERGGRRPVVGGRRQVEEPPAAATGAAAAAGLRFAASHGEDGTGALRAGGAVVDEEEPAAPPTVVEEDGARLGARAMIAFLCSSARLCQFSISSSDVSFCGTGQQATWYHEVIMRSPLSYDLPRRSVWFSIFWLHCGRERRVAVILGIITATYHGGQAKRQS